MLLVDTPKSGSLWDYPDKITLPQRGQDGPKVVYDLVARIFCSPTAGPHFTVRTVVRDGSTQTGRVAFYDDIKNEGFSLIFPRSKISTHLAGSDTSLEPPLDRKSVV